MRAAIGLLAMAGALALLLAMPAVPRAQPRAEQPQTVPPRAEQPPSLLVSNSPQYQAYVLERLEVLRTKYFPAADSLLQGSSHIHAASLMAANEVRAWRWTGDSKYAHAAVDRLRIIAGKVNDIRQADFFTIYPLTFAYRELEREKLVDEPLRQAMETFVAQRFVATDATSLHNQTLSRACGLELASQTWPHLKEATGWHEYAVKILGLLETIEDVPENSPNYNTFDLACTFMLADQLDRRDLLAQPGVKAMYVRYRDQVTPLGCIPPYGDAGNPSRPVNPNWPMNSPWAAYVAAFERAAREYGDPTLRWAALRVAATGSRQQPLGRIYTDVADLFYLGFVVDWADTSIEPKTPALVSAILTRRDRRSSEVRDKLILATSRKPGAPFLLSDLYVGGMHDHENQHGAVDYFEFGDQPLLTSLGYNSRGPEHTNQLLMRSQADPFPHIERAFEPGEWHESMLPTARLPVIDPKQPYLRQIDFIVLRVTVRRRGAICWAENLRLLGPEGKLRIVEDFKDLATWRGRPRPVHEPGSDSVLRWDLPQGVHFLQKARPPLAFDCREYPTLAVNWKLSSNEEQARPFILRVGHDFHLHTIQLEPTLRDAKVEQKGEDQYGLLRFSGWFTPDTEHERQIILTRDGILVVRDTLLPGATAQGMVAGPIWHFAPATEPQAGPNWYNATGGKHDLMVYFEPGERRSFGLQTTNVWRKENQRTVFAHEVVEPGRRTQFVSVLVPHSPDQAAAKLAEAIAVSTRDGRTSVRLQSAEADTRIDIADDGSWSVER